jgi:uncharacterized protein YndB with AHSA1/START domain
MDWTILLWVLGLIAVAVVAIPIIASTKPDTFRIERHSTINAPPEKVFPLINDFRQWTQWSPWEKKDPALRRNYSGAPSGKGSVYEWEGNKNVGKGRMEIIESTAPSQIVIDLRFISPFKAHNAAEFTFTPTGNATMVNWAMTGPNVFMSKVMSTFVNFEKMVGKDFEQGLANMKAAAER